ncbi:rhodanese-like domain-containing protein [Roseovarius sp. CAU 1744]|uniref:rhodanese-like domain-containing protein n=1 Tax=Roseovarius sp. CAU 1744 TaxID=3140368 RepID=UPI00325AAF63
MQQENIGGSVLETWEVDEVAQAWAANQIVLIDVRTVQEYALESIEGALLMPMAFFHADKLPGQSDKRIVFHCAGGARSERVARACIEAGIERIAHMRGGFGAWKAAKHPYLGINMGTGAPQRIHG